MIRQFFSIFGSFSQLLYGLTLFLVFILVFSFKSDKIKQERAIQWIERQDHQTDIDDLKPFTVIGSGLAGIEIAFALRKRWPERSLQLKILPGKINRKLRQSLIHNDIDLITNENLITGPALLCTGSATPQWLRDSGLLSDASGRVITRTTFQVIRYDDIFAVGDCGVIEQYARPASGVWAVRAATPLAKNLEKD